MDVIFDGGAGRRFSMEVGFFDTIQEIKEKIEKYHGIPAAHQTLIFDGQELQEDQDVGSAQLRQFSAVHLAVSGQSLPSGTIELLLRMPAPAPALSVHMEPDDAVSTVKQKAADAQGVPLGRVSLHFNGVELPEHRSLRDCGMRDGGEIVVVVREPMAPPPNKLRVIMQSRCGNRRLPLDVNPWDKVAEVRTELLRLHHMMLFPLPPEGYFFIHKQRVMDEDRSFRWHCVRSGDTIEIFNGTVTIAPHIPMRRGRYN